MKKYHTQTLYETNANMKWTYIYASNHLNVYIDEWVILRKKLQMPSQFSFVIGDCVLLTMFPVILRNKVMVKLASHSVGQGHSQIDL